MSSDAWWAKKNFYISTFYNDLSCSDYISVVLIPLFILPKMLDNYLLSKIIKFCQKYNVLITTNNHLNVTKL